MASTAKKARAILESHRLFPQISKPSRRRSNEKITRQTHSESHSQKDSIHSFEEGEINLLSYLLHAKVTDFANDKWCC